MREFAISELKEASEDAINEAIDLHNRNQGFTHTHGQVGFEFFQMVV